MNTPLVSNHVSHASKSAAFLALVAALLVVPRLSAAFDLGSSTGKTPYDPYMGPVFSVFGGLGGSSPDPATVEQWIAQGRAFRYSFNKAQPYKPQMPQETESTRAGDCKAKSLWLADKMDTRKVRYVIGKAKRTSNMNHAWLIWQSPNGWLILDPTVYSRSLPAERVSGNEFLAIYSYAPSGKYAHARSAPAQGSKYGDHL